ncbi:MAG: multicopper oxidase domain-containing protein [Burkholderiales bacterium]|nr:multicopper oxidase domain-containing protein [Burkholderiales bacterium]
MRQRYRHCAATRVRLNVGHSRSATEHGPLRPHHNGCSQGQYRPGNKLKVDLRNTLPATEPTFDCPDDGLTEHHRPHCFNTVNLHTHGLHVSPSGKSDNVLISIHPGQRFQYEYDIPRNHPAGTHWYHAHRHGATAIQVASGGAGVLIVRGDRKVQDKHRNGGVADIDTVLKDFRGRPLREQVMLFQQIEYACFDGPTSINPLQDPVTFESTCGASQVGEIRSYDTQMRFTRDPRAGRAGFTSTWDISGRYTSINGVVQPVLPKRGDQIVAGEIQRWRLVHGGVRDSINLKIVKIDPTALAAANVRDPEALVDRAMQRMRGARSKGAQQIELTNLCRGEVVKQVEFALDGHTRSAMSEKAVSSMHPGQRSDLLVAFPSAGLYCVLDEAADAASTINFRPDQPRQGQGPPPAGLCPRVRRPRRAGSEAGRPGPHQVLASRAPQPAARQPGPATRRAP